MQTLLTVVSAIWTQIVGGGSGADATTGLVGTISDSPLLLIPVAGAFASLIIGLTMKLMGIRRRSRR